MGSAVSLDSFLAEARLRRELDAAPTDAALLHDLAALCLLKGLVDEAEDLTERLMAGHPDHSQGWSLRAEIRRRRELPDQTEKGGAATLAEAPPLKDAGLELGRLAEERRDWAAALEAYYPCALADMTDSRAMQGVVEALGRLHRYDEAALALSGLCVSQWEAMGTRLGSLADLLRLARRPDDALAVARTVHLLYPGHGEGTALYGRALIGAGQPEEGLRQLDVAKSMGHGGFALHLARCAGLHLLGRLEEAATEAELAQAACPEDAAATSNLALLEMALGRWDKGLVDYEIRTVEYPLDTTRRWLGETMTGTLLVWGEQGLGDQVQCLRYIPLIRPLVTGRLVVQLSDPLLRLARGSIDGVDEWRSLAEPFDDYDRAIPMMSLIAILDKGAPGAVPVPMPFLCPPVQHTVSLPGGDCPTVGVCWAGSPGYLLDSIRSMPAYEIARLVRRFPGLTFVRLQRGAVGPHVGDVRPDLPLLGGVEGCSDYADTAAVVAQLDLVISVDTSIAHVAAALGKETWILLSHAACFRWGQAGEASQLYPTVRLFRQPRQGEGWGEVMDQLAEHLGHWAAEKHKSTHT